MQISKLSTSPLLEKVTQKDGLPSHQVHSLCFSNRKLWLSTPNGLAVYDGEEVEILNQSTGLLTHGQRSVSSHDDLIIVSSDRGLNILSAKNSRVLMSLNTVEKGLGWCQCSLMLDDKKFLLGCGNGLYLWDSKLDQVSQVSTQCTGEGVLNMVQSPNNLVLIQMSQSGVWYFNDGQLEPLLKHGVSHSSKIEHLNVSDSGFYLINSQHILSLDFELNLKEQILLPNGCASATKVLEKHSGVLIIVEDEKIYQLVRKEQCWVEGEIICENIKTNDLCYDHLDNLWIATEFSGLYKYSTLNQYIQYFTSPKSLSILAIRSAQNKQKILIGGTGTSYIVSTENNNAINEIEPLKNLTCWDIYQDSKQNIWAASNKGLAQVDLKSKLQVALYQSKDVGEGRCLIDLETDFLYGSVYGLFKFNKNNKTFSAINDNKGKSLSYVYSIVRKNSSQFFITTLGRSLWVYDYKNESLLPMDLLEGYHNVYDINCDNNNRYVIAAENKILLLEGDALTIVCETTNSVAAWSCSWYSESQIIMGTSEGLRVFNIEKCQYDFKVNYIPAQQFWEFTTSRSLFQHNDKQYWCGLNEALVLTKFEPLFKTIQPPIPEIKSIKSSTSFQKKDSSVVIEEGSWSIDIDLCSYWLWDEKSTLYFYRLVGFHDNWRQTQHTPIMYSSLPAGEYILEIKVINSLAQSNQKYQLLSLTVSKSGLLHSMFNVTKKLLTDFRIRLRQRSGFWKLYESNLELERMINDRTSELSLANQRLSQANESLEQLSNRDQLTGLYNRRAFAKFTDEELNRACRNNSVFGVLMIDIDYFKPFNDNYGHLAGDICLKQVADCLSACVHRSGDILARYGGEEFIVALPDADLIKAEKFASICVNAIRDIAIKHELSLAAHHVTISVGVTSGKVTKGVTKDDRAQLLSALIAQADENLYKAKEKGRNQYVAKVLSED